MREDRTKGSFVAFDQSAEALHEIGAFFKKTGTMVVAPAVKDILEEQIAYSRCRANGVDIEMMVGVQTDK